MAPQGAGGGKTPERLRELITQKLKTSSQSEVARETGLTQSAIGRYAKGIGEPTTATLEKLADYFGLSVAELRGDNVLNSDRFDYCMDVISNSAMSLIEKYGFNDESYQILAACVELAELVVAAQDKELEKLNNKITSIEKIKAALTSTNPPT